MQSDYSKTSTKSPQNVQKVSRSAPPGRAEDGAHRDPLGLSAAHNRPLVTVDTVGDLVSGYDDPRTGWESFQVKKLLASELVGFVTNLADWKAFITLTFKEEKAPDVAKSLFQWFVRTNNAHAFGEHYTRKVGHSYFSYVVGAEYQQRGVLHFHVLVDKPLDFTFVHSTWGKRCGFVWIDTKFKDKGAVVKYVCKYVVKGGEIDVYKAKRDFKPVNVPTWWIEDTSATSRVAQDPLFGPAQLAQPLTSTTKK